jgi:flagellar operon protein
MKIQNNQYLSLEQIQDQFLNQNKQTAGSSKTNGLSFQDILSGKTDTAKDAGEVKFSKHAANRLTDRNIELTQEQVERLNLGAAKAGEKGINESLVLIDSLAFIVNVPNATVITAMDQTETDENVFTNIDGAVIM